MRAVVGNWNENDGFNSLLKTFIIFLMKTLSIRRLEDKIAFSSLVQYAGKAIQLVLGILVTKMISRFLVDTDYSLYAQITELALFFSVVGNLGIFGNSVRMLSTAEHQGKTFSSLLVLRIVTGLIIYGLSIITVVAQGLSTAFVVGTLLFGGSLLFDYVTTVCDGLLQAHYRMGRANIALLAGRVVQFTTVLLVTRLVSSGIDVVGGNPMVVAFLLLAPLFASIITMILSLFFARDIAKFHWNFDRKALWKLLLLGLPFGIINITNNLYFRFLPDYFANHALSGGRFAAFSLSFKIAQVLSLFSTFLMFSVLPGFEQYLKEKDFEKARKLYRVIFKLMTGMGLLVAIGGSIFGPLLLSLLTDSKYVLEQFWFVLPMFLLLAAISYGYDLVLITVFAFGEERWFLSNETVALAISLLFFIIGSLLPSETVRLFMIILASLIGETFMVLAGHFKIRKLLSTSKKVTVQDEVN